MRYLAFFILYEVFKIWCIFYIYSTGQFELIIFQVFNHHMCLVATEFDNTGINDRGKVWNTK